MIPKIIHYCWFGNAPMNYMAKKCVRKYKIIKDAEIKEWNERNVDLSYPDFVVSAYVRKNYGFVSDYVRLKALYDYGGLYLDTDVEIKKDFNDRFWNADLVFSYMYNDGISGGFIMAKPHHPFIKRLLDCYETAGFSYVSNNIFLTGKILEYFPGFRLDGRFQEFEKNHFIYPKEYFHHPVLLSDINRGYSVHHFMGSWWKKSKSLKHLLRPVVKYILFRCHVLSCIYWNMNQKIYLKKRPYYQRYLLDKGHQ